MADWLDVSDDNPRVAYTATSGQTVFVVPFLFFDEDDLQVYQNDVLLTLSTHYVTSGAESETGGTVTLVTGATVGDSIVVIRVLVLELSTHIPPSGPLDIPAINLQFSRLVAMLQQVDDKVLRAVRQPDSDADTMSDLPTATARANSYLAFDANGDPIAAVSATAFPASTFMATLLDDLTAAAARTTLGITDTSAYTGAFNHLNFR